MKEKTLAPVPFLGRTLTSVSTSVRRLYNSFTKFSLPIGIGLSILFFSLSTALHFVQRGSLAEFFLAIITFIPISSLGRYATEDLVIRLQRNDYELLAGLLNGFFGNIAELCFVLTAVVKREPVIAQTTLTGALISSCLMIFGTSLLFGGLKHTRQYYPAIIARANAQLLVVSLVSITTPTAFRSWSKGGESGLLTVSRASAIVLLAEFASYIYWWYTLLEEEQIPDMIPALVASSLFPASLSNRVAHENRSLKELRAAAQEARLKNEQQSYSIYVEIPILIFSTVALVFASVYLLEAVYAPSEKLKLSETFVGLVIIPSILSTVDHVAAIIRSRDEGIAWVIETTFGSSIRISLFVFPIAVIFGWAFGIEVGMILDGFQVIVLGLAILLVNYVIHNGFTSWLEGTIFIASFLLFAIAAWFYPNNA